MPQRFLDIKDFQNTPLDPLSGTETTPHRWLAQHAQALAAALAAGRPLLIRGDPGVGKTQLGRAAAQVLQRAYVYQEHLESKLIDTPNCWLSPFLGP